MLSSLRKFSQIRTVKYDARVVKFIREQREEHPKLGADQIPHYFSYPHCPKIQTYIERYNSTIQEEFIDNNLDTLDDKVLLNQKLADYFIWYNTIRPHKSLNLKSPLQYLIEKGEMSQMSLTSTPSLHNVAGGVK